MVQAQIGQRVSVDMSGFESGGLSISGIGVSGVIVGIDAAQRLITVQLDVALNDVGVVSVPPERVSPA